MNIIGISGLSNSVAFKQKQLPGLSKREYNIAQGLDAAAALAGPQGIIAAAAEERFTREKATGAFPVNAIRYCLQAGNLRHQEVDFIAHGFSYESHRASFQADDFSRRQYVEVFSPEAQKRRLDEHFPKTGWSNKFVPVPHHLAHAASAFYVSGFDESLILISDGMGEVQSMTVAVGKGADITVLAQVPAFHSLGTLYGVFTLHLGFYMNSDEYKVMGLAPYGNSRRFFKQIMEFVSLKSDGTYTIPVFAQNHTLLERETHAGVLRFLTEKFGPAREPEAEITQSHKDIAAALQAVVQTCQLHVLRHFKRETGQRNVCLAGGVALNCAANGVIKRSELFDRVFVQPAAGDDGCALGAALYVQRLHEPEFKPRRMTVPLWGPEFSEREIRSIIAGREDCSLVEMESFDAVCKEVAARIDKGEIVAWFQGRMEFGPRALGSRSILADPRNPTMRDRINSLVKKREGFRPFAPVVTYEGASQLFEISPGDEETYAHMLFVTHTRQQYRDKLPATTHVDGSARVQTVARDHNPRLWQLLNEFATLTGIPALLNTSFNVRGQPIVCTPQEAIETFLFANLDVLVLGNLLVIPRKVEKVPDPDPSRLLELEEAAARHEEFWVNRLSALEPVALPCKRIDLRNGHSKGPGQMSRPLPPEVLAFLQTQKESVRPAELLLAAFAGYLARITGSESFDISFSESGLKEQLQGFEAQFAASLPLRPGVNTQQTFADALALVRVELEKLRQHKTYALDLPDRHPALAAAAPDSKGALLPIAVQLARTARDFAPLGGHELMLVLPEDASECLWLFNQNVLTEETVSAMAEQFLTFLEGIAAGATQPLNRLSVLSDTERHKILTEWNDTRTDGVPDLCVHEFFEEQARKTPDAVALVFEDQQLTYRELDLRASQVARHLQTLGVGPDVLVGICMEVSLELMVGLMGILKAGGAYVPLDPAYPKERLAFMLADSKVPVLLTQTGLLQTLPPTDAKTVCLDSLTFEASTGLSPHSERRTPRSDNLAYVIYTSGSTGKPKGVMIMHRNVANFFIGMDQRLGSGKPGVWLAVTSISFDISVLELFWTLARGFKVILQRREERAAAAKPPRIKSVNRPLDFSLFYFASDESASNAHKYRLLLEGAKFADEHGFAAIWTPERHFHAFGGLYPNPSVTSAAVAAITRRVQIRAGSVVLPLHNPIRVAEEWSVVDNLSNGRAGISFASGWQANDFVLAPQNHARRKELMLEQIELVRRLWRGETVAFKGVNGQDVPSRILPRPVQPELPIWITASGNPDTFRLAGESGANLLTHLLGQTTAELAEKLAVYRAARKKAGHAGDGCVTLMLHTFVGEDLETVRETVRGPFTAYLRSSIDLIKNDPWAFSTFKRPANGHANGQPAQFTEEELDVMADHAFSRYFETSGLFGTPQTCLDMVERLRSLGVDEIACLIDFGVNEDAVLSNLRCLNELRETASQPVEATPVDASIASQIVRHQVTHLQCTPSLAAMLLEDPKAAPALQSLQKLLLGGEALPRSLVQQLEVSGEIFNMYGPTETTIWSATDRVNKEEAGVSIGRPIANTEIYIVDKFLQPVPVGLPGELLIGGAGVVRGYLHRPDLTAEKFVANPFTSEPGARLYKTGDLARYLPDGRIEFLGRLDHQVKLRGFRIELGEIETVLHRHPAVKECVAIVREDAPGDKRLAAYLVAAPGHVLEAASLREFLKLQLPDYMVPSAFVTLASLPLTPNGKVDRKALPAPSAQPRAEASFAAPTSLTEQKVAEVMCAVLGLKQIGIHDDFFELGGNSLLATQLIARLREAFKWELPLRLGFEFPTVQKLADAIARESQPQPEMELPQHEIISRTEGPGDPLSFAQQRIWFLHQLEPGSHYNDHFDLRLSGPLDVSTLHRAINEIVRRHETLRSSFAEVEGQPAQTIHPHLALPLPLADLSVLPESQREAEAERLAIEDCRRPFDLEQGPLLRASLLRLAPQEHILVLTFDHIIVDGWSHGVFLSELTALYQAFLSGAASPLPELPIQYRDYAAWQQQWLQGKAIEPHLAYWKKQLAGAPSLLELPTDHPRPATQTYRGARLSFELDRPTMDNLSALGRQEGCTPFMVLFAAFQTLLARYSGSDDIVVGSPIANRNRAEVEGLIGSFMNTLAFRGDLSGDPSFVELLRRMREMALNAYAHQDLPFEKLVAELQPVRDLGYSPVFQVMFILQNTPMPSTRAGELTFSSYEVDAGSSKLDLTLNLEETPQGATGWVEYATDLFEAATIERMIANFKTLLTLIPAHEHDRLSQLPLITGKDRSPALPSVSNGFATPSLAAHETHRGNGNAVPLIAKAKLEPPTLADSAIASVQAGTQPGAQTPLEKELARIWSDVLGVEKIASSDNLFDLGGHSLLITRIISRIRKGFGVEVPIHAFFATPTLGAVAAIIETELAKGSRTFSKAAAPIRRLTRTPVS